MGTSEHSYRGVFDREKEVSWGIRKQLHLCVLVANRTQVTEIRVFPKSSLTLLQDLVHEWCLTLFRFPLLSAYACSSTNHQLLAGWSPSPSPGTHFQLCWLPTLFFPVTTLQLHLASHTTALPVAPACFPSHCPMLYLCSWPVIAQPPTEGFVFCTVPNLSTSPQTPLTLSVTPSKGNRKFHWPMSSIRLFLYAWGQVIWFIFH